MTKPQGRTAGVMLEANRHQSYAARMLRQTFRRGTARLGLAWVLLLAFVAAFAPLLASSRPLAVKENGVWWSPVWQAFGANDLAWAIAFITFALVVWWPISGMRKLTLIVVATSLAWLAGSLWLNPPQVVIHEHYREQIAAGHFEAVVLAPIHFSPQDYQRDRGNVALKAPSATHWFGTEENGADVLSRMIHAARIALGIGFVATGIALVLGVMIGGLMGYFSGIADMIGMRLVEIFEAIPTLFLLLAFVAFFGRDLYIMMVIIGLTSWPGYARYVRAEFLKLREQDYVQAAIAAGLPLPSILFRHMLPNGVAPILVAASFGVASAILAEATLSFLGLGLVDAPSWGQMLNQAVRSSAFNWWMAVFPGGAIFLTVFAYNLMGDALRDAIDPHLSAAQE
ncbi:MAG: ABC transporter permease [Thiotrichales bacterium]